MMACRRRERFVSDLQAKPAAGPKKAKTARKKIRRFISVNQTIAAFDSRSIHLVQKLQVSFASPVHVIHLHQKARRQAVMLHDPTRVARTSINP